MQTERPMTRLLLLLWVFLPGLLPAQPGWLVRYAPGATRSSLAEVPLAAQESALYPGSPWRRWHFDQAPDSTLLARLQGHPAVAALEREARYRSQARPNDPGFAEQWALHNLGQTGGPPGLDLRARDAWDFTTGSEAVTIAVIDAGIDWRHPDLIDNIWQNLAEDADGDGSVLAWDGSRWIFDPDDVNGLDDDGNGYVDDFIGWDFVHDDNDPSDDHQFGHGTHVAGIIAARGDNGLGIAGVSWRSRLMPLKFLDASGSGFTGDAIAALQYARQMGADLSNHSWGGGLYSQALRDELLLVQQADMLCVAAAGNNFGNDNDAAPLYPASYDLDHVIAVSATDPVDSLAPFANRGLNSVDLCAPGYGIYSTLPEGQYGYLNGTSMAAPFVTGALALLQSQRPNLNGEAQRQALLRSVRPLPSLRGLCATEGRLDLLALLQRPLLFQRGLPGTVQAGASLSDGRLLAVGEEQGDLWAACLRSDGEVAWSRRDQPGQWQAVAQASAGHAWLGGQANGTSLLARLDSAGQPLWTQQLDWGSSAALTQLVRVGSQAWAAGWYLAGSDTALWLARVEAGGQVSQRQRYALPGRDLRPVALAIHDDEAELGLLLRLDGNGSAWLRLDVSGNLLQADQIAWPNTSATLAHSLWGEDDAWTLSGHRELSNGERQLFVLEWEDDDGYEEGDVWPLGMTAAPSVSGAGRGERRWLLSGGAGTQGPGLRLLSLDEDGDDRLRRSYAWPGEAVHPVWVGQPRPGLVSWLLRRPGGGSYWGQSDEQGRSLCFVDSVAFSGQGAALPNVTPLSLNTLGSGGSAQTVPLSPGGSSAPATLLCDNSNCEVEAYFTLPSLTTCQEGDLIPNNLSQNATAYQWWLNGDLVETSAAPILEAPDDEGDYELILVALDGLCTDSFRVPIQVEPPLQADGLDTLHCGPRLTLTAPAAFAYRWRDENGDPLSDAQRYTFSQSGSYELELRNTCGESVTASYDVTLQGDCVWPGDVSADGQVNLVDYLLLGLVHGQSGPPRANAAPSYSPQLAPVWADSFASTNPWAAGISLAHADANGDGLIDAESDGALVRQHDQAAGLPRLAPDPTATVEVGLQLDTTVVQSGDSVGFQVELTSSDGQPIPEAYALALTLEASVPLSRPMAVSPQGSWLTVGGASDTLVLRRAGTRRLRVGLNRLDQQAALPASGLVMTGVIIVVIDDIGSYGALAERGFLSLAVTEALLIRPDGSRIALNPLGTQAARTLEVRQRPTSLVEAPTTRPWRVFPNPTQGRVQVQGAPTPGQDRPWRVSNLQGQTVATGSWPGGAEAMTLDLGHLPVGCYVLQVVQRGRVDHAKVWLR